MTSQLCPPYDVIAEHDCDGDEPPFAFSVGVATAYGGPDGLDPTLSVLVPPGCR